jgi:D-3-phosphoglycerate dehydrogenase
MRTLIIDDLHDSFIEYLESKRLAYDYKPDCEPDWVNQNIHNYEILVLRSKLQVDKKFLAQAKRLKFIARAGSGMDNIDELAAQNAGIVLINAGEANADAVAEHTLGLLISLLRNIPKAYQEVQNKVWLREENRGVEFSDLVVGIIGFGNTGSAFARKLSGLGCETIFYDKFLSGLTTPFAKESLLEQLFERADVLSFHIPLNEINKGLINLNLINNCKKPVYLLNVSRGGIMNTEDMVRALKQKKILGLGLDVLENEKPATFSPAEDKMFKELIAMPNVVVTPHIAGWTGASYRKISSVLALKLNALLT